MTYRLTLICLLFLISQPVVAGDTGKISVTGNAVLHVEPDHVVIHFHAQKVADTATSANDQLSNVIVDMLSIAQQRGIKQGDIKTSGMTITEDRRRGNDCAGNLIQAYQTVEVTLRAIDQVEELVDEMVAAGAMIQGAIQPGVDKLDEHQTRALELAVAKARTQATAVAAQLGQNIGAAIEVSFNAGDAPAPVARALTARDSSTRYIPGLIPVTQRVHVTFASDTASSTP